MTSAHFEWWVGENRLTLEDDQPWVLEPLHFLIADDIFAGFREVWAIIPEGNTKTTFFGGLGLYMADHAHSPWIPIGAASREQAEIMFGQMGGFVERSSKLQERFRVFEGYRKIKCANGGRGIKVYAAAVETGDGVIPYPIAFVDEPHRHKDTSLYRLWKGKLNKRGAQIATMSTAGEPYSEFENMRESIRNQCEDRVQNGCHLRAVGKGVAYHEWMVPSVEAAKDLEIVKQANPFSGITIPMLEDKLASPTLDYGNDWLRLTCNIATRSSQAAIPELDWDRGVTDERIPAGVPIAVGADFAFLEDTTALVPLFWKSNEFRLFGDPVILEPPGDRSMLDVNEIKARFEEIHERNPISVVVADRHKAEDILQWLANDLGVGLVIDRPQTNAFQAQDYERFMEGLRDGKIKHTGDAKFRLHVLSAISARLPGDKHRFDRPRTQRKAGKDNRRIVIDALTAAAMVHSHMASGQTSYAERGLVAV